jgi:alkylresorcinol/alkylpyrone synthase
VLATRSVFYPDTERVMGWDVTSEGFRVVLSAAVPQVVEKHLGADVYGFLADQGLTRVDVESYVCHPGGPKVIEAIQRALGLDDEALAITWRSLRAVGNLSSASVLLVLGDTLRERRPRAGSLGLLIGMGPGFCSELLLLEW